LNVTAAAVFAFVASITPGPNNVMLWASGMNYGFRRTIPHLAGVNLGFMSLIVATAAGLGTMFENVPWLPVALRIGGSVYLIYFAYRIATAGRASSASTDRPFTFLEAATFQYVNPKAWVIGITAAGTFLPSDQPVLAATMLMTGVFAVVNLPCITTWAAAGTALGRLFDDDRRRRMVNWILAVLLLWTVYLINI
jgi:threonine/homoserine/homoserine lactone efflux protein